MQPDSAKYIKLLYIRGWILIEFGLFFCYNDRRSEKRKQRNNYNKEN